MTLSDSVTLALESLLAQFPVLEPGHVWLAGAGPGDPGHLTLHALAGLMQADAVVHDALVDPRILALAPASAERIFAGKRGGKPSAVQADITARLIDLARAGRRVVRLKGGDPYVFGRGGEEVLTLAREGVPFRVIPGITAGLAGLAAASIPATLRGVNQAVVFATGHSAEEEGALDWAALARLNQPIVLYMAMRNLGAIASALVAGGLSASTPVAVIASATTPDERLLITTLGEAPEAVESEGIAPPAIVAIGGIVAVREQILALMPEIEENRRWFRAG
jgi:uroporphyrin-III C-methyltransferase